MLPVKFGFNWPSGFKEEDFIKISQSETMIACGGNVVVRFGRKPGNIVKDLSSILRPSWFPFGLAV